MEVFFFFFLFFKQSALSFPDRWLHSFGITIGLISDPENNLPFFGAFVVVIPKASAVNPGVYLVLTPLPLDFFTLLFLPIPGNGIIVPIIGVGVVTETGIVVVVDVDVVVDAGIVTGGVIGVSTGVATGASIGVGVYDLDLLIIETGASTGVGIGFDIGTDPIIGSGVIVDTVVVDGVVTGVLLFVVIEDVL